MSKPLFKMTAFCFCVLGMLLMVRPTMAQTDALCLSSQTVGTEEALNEAIACYNDSNRGEPLVVTFSADIILTEELLDIDNGSTSAEIVFNGANFALDGNQAHQVLSILAGTVTINNLTIQNGLANSQGGGITNHGRLTISNSVIRNNVNQTSNGGGGIRNLGHLTINDSTIADNVGTSGGGILNADGEAVLILNSSAVINNETTSGDGGGIANSGGKLAVSNATISSNTSKTSGGGIFSQSEDETTIANTLISENTAAVGAGASILGNNATILNSAVIDNVSQNAGAGISLAGTLEIINTTISGNKGSAQGGGIYTSSGNLTAIGSTITNNTAPGEGSGIFASTSQVSISSSIIASNGNGANCGKDFPASFTVTHSLMATSGATECGITDGVDGNVVGVDPKLDALADNGGLTPTHALQEESPAIDAGKPLGCEVVDQRGYTRDPMTCDMGAFEVGASVCANPAEVTDETSFETAIGCFNAQIGGPYIASIANDITLSNNLMSVDNATSAEFMIAGNGHVLDGANAYRHLHINNGTVEIANLTLQNALGLYGGSLHNKGTLTVKDSVLQNNQAEYEGGAIHNYGTLSVQRTTIDSNQSDWAGGIYNSGAAEVIDSTISNNTPSGILNNRGSLTVKNSTFSDNQGFEGGGIFNKDGTLVVMFSLFENNVARFSGGGINTTNSAEITNTLFTNNKASSTEHPSSGGAIFATNGTTTITNSTISGNFADIRGGGIENYGILAIYNSTITENESNNGDGIFTGTNSLTLVNSIVAGNAEGEDCLRESGTATSSYSLFSTTGSKACGQQNEVNGNLTGVAPGLAPLADNGGPTQTHALLPYSPAIDSAKSLDCLTYDQRGVPRLGEKCDMGAYETDWVAPPTEDIVYYLPALISP